MAPTRDKLTRNPAAGYVPGTAGGFAWASVGLDGMPVFVPARDVPRMLSDARVSFDLRLLCGTFAGVKFKVTAPDARVAAFVGQTLRKFWRQTLPPLLHHYFCWGFAPATFAVEEDAQTGLLAYAGGTAVSPPDARPYVRGEKAPGAAGQMMGFTVPVAAGAGKDGVAWVGPGQGLWFAGRGEYGRYYDRPRLAGAFGPFLEKNGRDGAVNKRRVWYAKWSGRGGILYHPPGMIENEDGTEISGQDKARQLLEVATATGHFTFPNTVNPGDTARYEWHYVDAESTGDVKGFLEYPQHLDNEIDTGLGIPTEVFEAAETGSGFSGRAMPFLAHLATCDELAGQVLDAFVKALVRPLVDENFGEDEPFEAECVPLAETTMAPKGAKDQPPAPAGRGGDPGDAGGQPAGGDDYGMPPADGQAADLGRAGAAPPSSHLPGLLLHYAMCRVAERAAERGRDPSKLLHALAAGVGPAGAASMFHADLGWTRYSGPRGGVGWKNDETGRVFYSHGEMPGQKREKAKASASRAREITALVHAGEATPEHFQELADHLPALTVDQLRSTRRQLGLKLGGLTRRDEMAGQLIDHARHLAANPDLIAAAARPEEGPAPAPEPAVKPAAAAPPAPPPPVPPTAAPASTNQPAGDADWRAGLKGKPRWQAVETLRQKQPYELTADEYHDLKTFDHEDTGKTDPSFGATGLRMGDLREQETRQYSAHNRSQWEEARDAAFIAGKPVGQTPHWAKSRDEYKRSTGNDDHDHEAAVRGALAAGKPVPPDVLADYPDLTPGAATTPVEPAKPPVAQPAFPRPVPPADDPKPVPEVRLQPKPATLFHSAGPAAAEALDEHDPANWDKLAAAGKRDALLRAADRLGRKEELRKLPASKIAAALKAGTQGA